MPMEVQLPMPGDDAGPAAPVADAQMFTTLEELRNELAELEELAETRGAELQRLAEGLSEAGWTFPNEDDRRPGWLVDQVLASIADEPASVDVTPLDAAPEAAAAAPRPPRKRVPPVTGRG